MDKILGIINLHNDWDFDILTKKKNIATTSFLGRYYFIDFVLSRFANNNINSVEILVKDKPISLFKHLHISSKESSINTKLGGVNLMYNELESKRSYMNTDFNTLLANKKYLYNYNQAFVVFAPCEIISNINYQEMLESHIMSGKPITVAYCDCSKELEKYDDVDKLFLSSDNTLMKYLKKDSESPNVYMETFIMHKSKLLEILENFDLDDEIPTMKEIISYAARLEEVNVYKYEGFLRYFRSLENYIEYSLEMLNPSNYALLFNNNTPIYTKDRNKAPTLYGNEACVQNCFVADGCKINGKVSNSIIGRSVIIDKGAIVNNCIVFSKAHIESGCIVEDAIIENGTKLTNKVKIKGNIKKPAYIKG